MRPTSSPPAAKSTGAPRSPRFAAVQALAAGLDPDRYLRRRLRRDGDPFRVWFPGLGDVLFTASPDGARDVFQASPELLSPPRPNPIEPLLGAGSLILLAGDRHRRERKLMMPPFHGDRMRAYARIIHDATRREIEQWQPGRPVRIQRAAQAITLQVIIAAIFGIHDAGRRAEYAAVIASLLEAYTPALLLVPALRRSFAGMGPWARFTRHRARFDQLLSDEIAGRRQRPDDGGDDILSLLLATRYEDGQPLGHDDLLDELRTLLVAGHETTATALTWALFHVHRDDAVRRRVLDELVAADAASPERLAQLPYLGATCQEALRMHPVVPIVLRRVAADVQLAGVEVRAGATIGVAVSLLHAHRETWPEADRFAPERFLERKYTPFEYAPFGGGHRRCLGAAFAAYEMRIVLGTILAGATLALSERDRRRPPPTAVPKSITVGPRQDIVMTVVARH